MVDFAAAAEVFFLESTASVSTGVLFLVDFLGSLESFRDIMVSLAASLPPLSPLCRTTALSSLVGLLPLTADLDS